MRESARTAGATEFVLLALLGILWGIPYALTKISLSTIPPLTMVAARVSLAAIVLWIVVFVRGCEVPKRTIIAPRLLLQGWLACALPYTLIAFGQHSIDSALAGILNSMTPVFVCLIGFAWSRHEALPPVKLFGVFVGLAGVIMLAGVGALLGIGQSALGQAAILLATMISAVSVIYGRKFADVAPEVTAAGALTAAALTLVPISFLLEQPLQCVPSTASLVALLVNAIIATALGFVVYFRLIRTIGSVGTASVGYLKLAVAVLIGCTLMGETLNWTAIVGLVAILVGVIAINGRELSIQSWFGSRVAPDAARTF